MGQIQEGYSMQTKLLLSPGIAMLLVLVQSTSISQGETPQLPTQSDYFCAIEHDQRAVTRSERGLGVLFLMVC
jgi:hypothetical protein